MDDYTDLNQRMRGKVKTRNKASGGGKPLLGLRYGARWTPSTKWSWVHLWPEKHTGFNGADTPYFEYMEHFSKTRNNQGSVCSREWVEDDRGVRKSFGNCVGCYELDIAEGDGEKGDRAVSDISLRPLAAFTGVHLADYHLVEVTDRETGRVVTYKKGNKWHKQGDPIMRRVPCIGRGCEHCQARAEKVFGKYIHWSLGTGHFGALSNFVGDLAHTCAKCGDNLVEMIYMCPNCSHKILDLTPSAGNTMTDDAIYDMVSQPCKCRNCGKSMLPRPIYECEGCKNPQPLGLFDVSFQVRKTSDEFPKLDFGTVRQEPIPEDLMEMFPKGNILHRVFKGDPIRKQMKVFNLGKNPFGSEEAVDYRRNDDAEEPEGADEEELLF